jgi:hypothetical protein
MRAPAPPAAAAATAGHRQRRHPSATTTRTTKARTTTAATAAASLLFLLSLLASSGPHRALAQSDDDELARIAAITTVLDLSAPTPAVSGGSLVFAGGRMRAAAAGAPGGEEPARAHVSPEEAEAAYDALQAQVEARLEQERQDALRVLELARQGGKREAAGAKGEEEAGAPDAGPSADEVARAAAIAEHPWRAHRCTTAHPSDEERDRMDEAVRADLQLQGLAARRRRLQSNHHHHRHLASADDPFDVEFTPDPFSGLSREAVVAAADAARRNPTIVRTYVHVVAPTATAGPGRGAVADATLLAQMRVLNATYSSAGFQFRLEAVTRVISSSFATAEVASGAERSMKRALRRGGRDSLNIFVTSPPALLGWSTFPESARTDRDYDGVVTGFYTLPGSSMKPYNKGMTMAHEVGHWLGLLHTFEGEGCSGLGDRVSDVEFLFCSSFFGGGAGGGRENVVACLCCCSCASRVPGGLVRWWIARHHAHAALCAHAGLPPPRNRDLLPISPPPPKKNQTPRESGPAFGCPSRGSVDTCPSDPGADSVSNFMQYTDDACMSSFTPGQVARMSALWRQYRGTAPPPPAVMAAEDQQQQLESGSTDAGRAEAAAPPPPRRRRRVTTRGG